MAGKTLWAAAGWKRFLKGSLLAGVVAATAVPGLQAVGQANDQATAPNGRAVRLSYAQGGVKVAVSGSAELGQALPNMPLAESSHLETADDGQAEIQLEDGSIVRVAPDSAITFVQMSGSVDSQLATDVQLDKGLLYVEGARTGSSSLRVMLGYLALAAGQQSIFRVDLDSNPSTLAVMNGEVEVSGDYSANVRANETLTLGTPNGPSFALSQGITGDSWDNWNQDRDKQLAQMAGTRSQAVQDGEAQPGNPAWSDLDAYGDWYNVPGSGNVWQPTGVDPNWDPYGSGAWNSYPGIGYMWISSYPWGYLPYRCGAWNYYQFGWGWSPSGCNNWFAGGFGWGGGAWGGWPGYVNVIGRPDGYRPPPRPRPIGPIAHPMPGHTFTGSGPVVIRVDRNSNSRYAPRLRDGNRQGQAIFIGDNEKVKPMPVHTLKGEGVLPGSPSILGMRLEGGGRPTQSSRPAQGQGFQQGNQGNAVTLAPRPMYPGPTGRSTGSSSVGGQSQIPAGNQMRGQTAPATQTIPQQGRPAAQQPRPQTQQPQMHMQQPQMQQPRSQPQMQMPRPAPAPRSAPPPAPRPH